MKPHRPRNRSRACAHCGQRFVFNPRLGPLHRFCTLPKCAKASRCAARKRWLKKNGGKAYYLGGHNNDRVRAWRRRHPRYWKNCMQSKYSRRPDFALSKKLAEVLGYVALQDTIDTRLALEIGIISQLSGVALQDTIATEIRRLMLRGYAILGHTPPDSLREQSVSSRAR